jgi:hypothetical protein
MDRHREETKLHGFAAPPNAAFLAGGSVRRLRYQDKSKSRKGCKIKRLDL